MAEVKVKGFLTEVESMCECTICYHMYDDIYRIPRVLPCQHTFCTECLTKHCRRRKLKCPLCNQEHSIRTEHVDKLPKDYTRCNLKDLYDKFTQSLCKECQNQKHVKYICKTCNLRMCSICYNERKQGLCLRHTIKFVENKSPITPEIASSSDSLQSEKSVCMISGHENNELKYFCCEESCSKPVCANCIVELHKNHLTKQVKDVYESRKQSMQSQCESAECKVKKARDSLDILLKHIVLITESNTKGQNKLKEQALQGKGYITDFENRSIQNGEEKLSQYMKLLEEKKERIQYFIDNASECCSISQQAITGKNIVSFLSVEKTLKDKLAMFDQSDFEKPYVIMREATEFELEEDILELRNKINKMTSTTNVVTNKSSFVKVKNLMNWCEEMWQKTDAQMIKFFIWITIIMMIVFAIIKLWAYPIPLSHFLEVDKTSLAYRKSNLSMNCYSIEGQIVSNIPMEGVRQTCGNANIPYIFRGAFTNVSFLHRQEDYLTIRVDVFGIKEYTPGLVLFEFGISNDAIQRRNLLGPISLTFYGWVLKVLNSQREVALINTKGNIVFSNTISVLDQTTYTFYIELNPSWIIELRTNYKTGKLIDKGTAIKGNNKRGFAKLCSASVAHVTVKIMNDNVGFNRSTLYPNVYIAPNDKTISNKPLSSFSKREIENKAFQDIMLLNCDTVCVYVLYFRVKSVASRNVFSVFLTNSQFLSSAHYNISLFTYTSCTDSYCLLRHVDDGRSSVLKLGLNKWHQVTIMIDRKKKSGLILVGNHKIEIENGYLFERYTPVLRWLMRTSDDGVEIRLGDYDDFDILTWFRYQILPFHLNEWFFIAVGFCLVQTLYWFEIQRDNRVRNAHVDENIFIAEPVVDLMPRRGPVLPTLRIFVCSTYILLIALYYGYSIFI